MSQVPLANERRESYLTPTSDRFQVKVTNVAPLLIDLTSGQPTRQTACNRHPLETRDQVETLLAAAGLRLPRLPLVDASKAREKLAAKPCCVNGCGSRRIREAGSFP